LGRLLVETGVKNKSLPAPYKNKVRVIDYPAIFCKGNSNNNIATKRYKKGLLLQSNKPIKTTTQP
jgi:hypothetical protein